MRPIGRQPRAPDVTPVHYERHRPEQTTLYRLVQQHAASFIAHTEASTGAELPRFIKDKFEAFLECGILYASAREAAAQPVHRGRAQGGRSRETACAVSASIVTPAKSRAK